MMTLQGMNFFFLYFRGMKLFSCLIYLFTIVAFPDIKKILTDSVLNKAGPLRKEKPKRMRNIMEPACTGLSNYVYLRTDGESDLEDI